MAENEQTSNGFLDALNGIGNFFGNIGNSVSGWYDNTFGDTAQYNKNKEAISNLFDEDGYLKPIQVSDEFRLTNYYDTPEGIKYDVYQDTNPGLLNIPKWEYKGSRENAIPNSIKGTLTGINNYKQYRDKLKELKAGELYDSSPEEQGLGTEQQLKKSYNSYVDKLRKDFNF